MASPLPAPPRADPLPPAWPVLVAGGGLPSLAFALALRRAAGAAVSVAVADPAPFRTPAPDPRAFALSPASVLFLDALGLWDDLRADAQPVVGMTITDSRLPDAPRPDYLSFEAPPGGGPLAHVVGAEPLRARLRDACRDAGIAALDGAVRGFALADPRIRAELGGGEAREACLLVAADGSRSRLRELAGIGWTGRRYDQSALVGTLAHERDAGGRAVQHFLPGGPFALLPMRPGGGPLPFRSSLVWTERTALVPGLLAASGPDLDEALTLRAGPAFGAVTALAPLRAHPLAVGLARRFVAPRLALLGDAAHEVHPLAGQGLNLAFGDAASLAERVVEAVRLGLDPGGPDVLRAYERDRRIDAVTLAGLTDGLNRLFSNDRLPARALRDLGLGLVDRLPFAKGALARAASGVAERAPRLMRGEAI